MINLGDFRSQQTVYLMTNAHKADGTPIDGAGGLAVSVYKDDGTTEYASDITLVGPFDSRTGLISLKIITTNAFYVAGHDYFIVVTTGTVDSISVVSYVLAAFSIENRSALMSTESGRKLDVTATGEAGLDFTNRLDTTGILPNAQAGAASGLAIVGSSMAVADKTGFSLSVTPPTAQNIWEYATRSLTDKAGFALSQSFPSNFASLAISSLGKVTVGTNDDKTGYALTTALTAQNVWEYATRALTDKAGFSLSTSPPTVEEIDEALSDAHGSGDWGNVGGAVSRTYTVYEEDETTPISACEVWASSDEAGTLEIANRGYTNDLGQHTFYFDLPAGTTVYIWRRKAEYDFNNPDEETI